MIQGTTALFKFKMPCTKTECEWIQIKFWQTTPQGSYPLILKTLSCCEIKDNPKELYVSLTETETMKFSPARKLKVQLRGKNAVTGTIFSHPIKLYNIYPINDDAEIILPDHDEVIILDGQSIVID